MLKTSLSHLFYNVLITLSLPFALLRLVYKSHQNPDYRRRLGERLACQLPKTEQPIWIHTVSVGEFLAVLPLIKALQKVHSPLLVTTTTPTGSAMLKEKLGDTVVHCYLPFDIPVLAKRFICHVQPAVAVFVETEIWPNYLFLLKKQTVPTLLINARLSEKSFRGYAKTGKFARQTLTCFTEVACQNKASQQRFQQLGAKASVLGNIKFDLAPPDDLPEKQARLHQLLGNQPFVLAASTHKGEDEIILKAFRQSKYADTHRIIIAPRHPERSEQVMALCQAAGYHGVYYTQCVDKPLAPNVQVVVVDTLGELLYFYSLAAIAVIGGSFVPHGGHNPLEAALFAVPCCIGEHYFNFDSLVKAMVDNNAIILTEAKTLLTRREDLREIGSNAKTFLAGNQGALQRYVRLILQQIDCR